MSFLKKVKDRFTRPNASVSLQFSKGSYSLGENVEGTLAVTSSEEFDAKEIRCEFECVETKKVISNQYDSTLKMTVPKEVQESAKLWSSKPQLSGPVHLTNGFAQNYTMSINIPATGRPTYRGVDQNVKWTLKGVMAIDGRPDVTSPLFEIPVTPQSASPVVKEVIREVVMIPCKYCGTLMEQTVTLCPNCGARRTG